MKKLIIIVLIFVLVVFGFLAYFIKFGIPATKTGYLISCPWQSLPSLPDYQSKVSKNCFLDFWISKNGSCGLLNPSTSVCFFENLNLNYPDIKDANLKMTGRYRLAKTCQLIAKMKTDYKCGYNIIFVPEKVEKLTN